jgi:ketosteroid isomerase-like protein
MTTTNTTTAIVDVETLSRAIEARDADAVLANYAPDATLSILDRDHPPSAPLVYTGSKEIGDYYRDICGRNLEHQVRDAVATAGGLAYAQHCRYPDGAAVVCATVATVHDGKIQTQTAVQAWDS